MDSERVHRLEACAPWRFLLRATPFTCLLQPQLVVRRRQPAIPVRIGARLAAAEFTLLSWFGAASGAVNIHRLLLLDFHNSHHAERAAAWLVNCDQSTANNLRLYSQLPEQE